MIALIVGLRLIAPYDVPLGVGVERIHLRTRVVGNACGLVRMSQSLGRWAEEKLASTAVKSENDNRPRAPRMTMHPSSAYKTEKDLTRA